MTNDQAGRPAPTGGRKPLKPGTIATLIAIPVAVIVGFAAFQFIKPPVSKPASPRAQSTAPVSMAAPQLSEMDTVYCRAAIARLPETVRDLNRRPVTAGSEQNAAFGEPPMTIACGTTIPSFPETDLVYALNKVCWHPTKDGTSWTTVDRVPAITVTLPSDLAGAGSSQWPIAISSEIDAAIPAKKDIPFGCKS